MNKWMAASDATPNNPKNPEMTTVNTLIGICSPIAPPKIFKKNKHNTPIANLTELSAMKRIGFTGAPTISRIIMSTIINVMTSVELNRDQLLFS